MDDFTFLALLTGVLFLFVLGGLWADTHLDSPRRSRDMAHKVRA